MGAGAKVWNPMALWAGLITAALIIPVFLFRHYIQDKGKFPAHMLEDLGMTADGSGDSARPASCPISRLLPVLSWFSLRTGFSRFRHEAESCDVKRSSQQSFVLSKAILSGLLR